MPTANNLVGFLPMIAIFGIFYVLVFLPMQKEKKDKQLMLQNLKKGDVVVTTGGIVGIVSEMSKEDDTIVIKVKPDSLRLQVARNAIATVVNPTASAS